MYKNLVVKPYILKWEKEEIIYSQQAKKKKKKLPNFPRYKYISHPLNGSLKVSNFYQNTFAPSIVIYFPTPCPFFLPPDDQTKLFIIYNTILYYPPPPQSKNLILYTLIEYNLSFHSKMLVYLFLVHYPTSSFHIPTYLKYLSPSPTTYTFSSLFYIYIFFAFFVYLCKLSFFFPGFFVCVCEFRPVFGVGWI